MTALPHPVVPKRLRKWFVRNHGGLRVEVKRSWRTLGARFYQPLCSCGWKGDRSPIAMPATFPISAHDLAVLAMDEHVIRVLSDARNEAGRTRRHVRR